jgi:hypothetical protein
MKFPSQYQKNLDFFEKGSVSLSILAKSTHRTFILDIGDVHCHAILLNKKPVLTYAEEYGYKLLLEPLMLDPEFMAEASDQISAQLAANLQE